MPKAVRDAGFEYSTAELGAVALNYVRGPANGTPLVLVPAQMATWETYAESMPSLAQRFEVFVLDVCGHGASSWTSGHYDWSVAGDDLARFIEEVIGGSVLPPTPTRLVAGCRRYRPYPEQSSHSCVGNKPGVS